MFAKNGQRTGVGINNKERNLLEIFLPYIFLFSRFRPFFLHKRGAKSRRTAGKHSGRSFISPPPSETHCAFINDGLRPCVPHGKSTDEGILSYKKVYNLGNSENCGPGESKGELF